MLEAMVDGLTLLMSTERLYFLTFGVLVGLALGAILGLGSGARLIALEPSLHFQDL